MDENELIQYFIVNEDIKDREGNIVQMSGGKLAVQVAHVEVAITLDFQNDPVFDQWAYSDLHKKIILRAHEKKILQLIKDHEGIVYWTKDAGLTEIAPDQITVIGLPPMTRDDAQLYVKRLQLYKG